MFSFFCKVFLTFLLLARSIGFSHQFVSDIAIFVLKRDVKLQLTNFSHQYYYAVATWRGGVK